MSYGRDYRNRSYPGNRIRSPDDMTDEHQILGLGPREGDTEVNHDTLNHPWGKVALLNLARKTLTFVQTETSPRPHPWAIRARFSLDGITYTPEVPAGWGGERVRLKFTQSFDVKTGAAIETVDLFPGDALSFCGLIARSLVVDVTLILDADAPLYVALVVCPTEQIDCGDLIPVPTPGGDTTPMSTAASARVDALAGIVTTVPAEPRRRNFTVVNQSNANLYVYLGDTVDILPGEELATVVLAPGVYAGYEVLNYTGIITFAFDDDDEGGYALYTQGLVPA